MTTTTDLLRRAAEDVYSYAMTIPLGPSHEEKRVRAGSLLALADEMERSEPVATLHDDGHWTWQPGRIESMADRQAGWRMEVYTHPAPEVQHPLDALLPELCQLLDGFKREAESNGDGWTEWDESVRSRLRKCLADYNVAAMQEPKP